MLVQLRCLAFSRLQSRCSVPLPTLGALIFRRLCTHGRVLPRSEKPHRADRWRNIAISQEIVMAARLGITRSGFMILTAFPCCNASGQIQIRSFAFRGTRVVMAMCSKRSLCCSCQEPRRPYNCCNIAIAQVKERLLLCLPNLHATIAALGLRCGVGSTRGVCYGHEFWSRIRTNSDY